MNSAPTTAANRESRTPQIPTELIEAFRAKPSRVVLLIGAGISRLVRRPDDLLPSVRKLAQLRHRESGEYARAIFQALACSSHLLNNEKKNITSALEIQSVQTGASKSNA